MFVNEVIYLFLESESTVSLSDVNFLVEESTDENSDAARRNSQGSLGQKYRSPDISATPTSPSAYSWCPESMISSPVSTKCSYLPSKKSTLKDRLFHNYRTDAEGETDSEYCIPPGAFFRINQKIAVRSKMKLRSRTVNFLRQLKKPQSNQGPNNVVLLGVKKLETCSVASGIAKASRVPFALESGIRHSQSTLSVMSNLYTEGGPSIPNSESMPDLSSGYVPPPPPPPFLKSKHLSTDIPHTKSNYLTVNQDVLITSDQAIKKSESLSHIAQPVHASDSSLPLRKKNGSHKTSSPIIANGDCSNDKSTKSGNWQESSDEVFDRASLKLKSNTLPKPISNQPSKSDTKCIFDGVKKKKSHKSDPPPPLSLTSEDLDSSVTGSNVSEICPPSPPVQFKDPPKTDKSKNVSSAKEKISKSQKKKLLSSAKSNTSWSNDSCLTTIICQGTLFFPRPPAQFIDDVTESPTPTDTKETNSNSEGGNANKTEEQNTNKTVQLNSTENNTEDLEEKNSKNLQKNTFFDTKCTILEMLTDLSEPPEPRLPLYAGDTSCPDSLNSIVDRQRSYSLVAASSAEEEAPSIRRASVIGSEMIR